MIYRRKALEVCRQGLNITAWNHWILLIGFRVIACTFGQIHTFRIVILKEKK